MLVSCVLVRNSATNLSSQHHDNTYMGKEKDFKPEIIMHHNATRSRVDILDKLVKEYACTRSTKCWPLKLCVILIDAACVSIFILCILNNRN